MDNKIFRVNGEYKGYHGTKQLELAVELLMRQHGYEEKNKVRVDGWSFSKEKGLILHWYIPSNNTTINKFPTPLGPASVVDVIVNWLESEQANEVELDDWCHDANHDGHNGMGFLLYREDWGHIGHDSSAMFAVKPCYMWYGK